MVENNEQWEDVEYSDNQDSTLENSDYNEEYSENSDNQEYDDSYDEYEDDEESETTAKKSNPLPLLLIFVILVGLIIFILFLKSGSAKQQTDNANMPIDNNYVTNNMDINTNNAEQNQEQDNSAADSFFENSQDETGNSNMMSVNFNDSGQTNVTTGEGESQQVATVTDASSSNVAKESDLFDTQSQAAKSSDQENNAIMVVYNKAARSNPFKPPVLSDAEQQKTPDFEILNNVPFEVIEPPKTSIVDENLNRLLKTQISGILYDSVSPSAIVNLNGLDHFVKVGDTISGYKIMSITKDKVQISYKNNSYVASVGELFTPGDLEKQQSVANLQNKFAGRYKN